MSKLIKTEVIKSAIKHLESEIKSLEETSLREHEHLKEAPGAMQSHSDTTRSQKEALLFGYSKKIQRKKQSINALQSIGLHDSTTIKIGSLVEVYEDDHNDYYFIIPGVSGEKYIINNIVILAISPESAIARALIDLEEGDLARVEVPSGIREMEIISIE